MPAKGLRQLWNDMWGAFQSGKTDDAKRIGDEIFLSLESAQSGDGTGTNAPRSGVRTSQVPQVLVDHTAGKVQSPLNRAATTKGQGVAEGMQTSFDVDAGHNLRVAVVADGEAVTPNVTVCVLNNVAYLADGTNAARPCHGVCVRGTGNPHEVYWRAGGTATVRLKRGTAVSEYGTLYQSATAGVLTNDPAEVGLAYVQQVGHFKGWIRGKLEGDAPDVAEINIQIGGSGSGGGGTGAAYIDGGSFSDTYTSSPFDIDGGVL